jgi:hypothetical protein
MTNWELPVFLTGAAAILSAVPYARVLRGSLELTRARVFLKYRTYVRLWRILALVGAPVLGANLVSIAVRSEEQILRTFVPVDVFEILFFLGICLFGWTIYDVARGPRQSAAAAPVLLLGAGTAAKGALLATGIPAVLCLLVLAFRLRPESEIVKARFYLGFRRLHKMHEAFVYLIAAAMAGNMGYVALHPEILDQKGLVLTPGHVLILFHVGFIFVAGFVTAIMSGSLFGWKPRRRAGGLGVEK